MHALTSILFSIVSFLPSHGSCPQWESTMKDYKLPIKEFSYIAYRESRCRIKAINAKFDKQGNVTWTLNRNGSIDRGLFQINSVHKQTVKKVCKGDLDLLLTLDCNFRVAKYLYERYGLSPWKVQSTSLPSSVAVRGHKQ